MTGFRIEVLFHFCLGQSHNYLTWELAWGFIVQDALSPSKVSLHITSHYWVIYSKFLYRRKRRKYKCPFPLCPKPRCLRCHFCHFLLVKQVIRPAQIQWERQCTSLVDVKTSRWIKGGEGLLSTIFIVNLPHHIRSLQGFPKSPKQEFKKERIETTRKG